MYCVPRAQYKKMTKHANLFHKPKSKGNNEYMQTVCQLPSIRLRDFSCPFSWDFNEFISTSQMKH